MGKIEKSDHISSDGKPLVMFSHKLFTWECPSCGKENEESDETKCEHCGDDIGEQE